MFLTKSLDVVPCLPNSTARFAVDFDLYKGNPAPKLTPNSLIWVLFTVMYDDS